MVLGLTAKKDPSEDRAIVRGGFGQTSSRGSSYPFWAVPHFGYFCQTFEGLVCLGDCM